MGRRAGARPRDKGLPSSSASLSGIYFLATVATADSDPIWRRVFFFFLFLLIELVSLS